ncbi:MAG: UDP-N-acetylmuramate dehydrogenase [Bacteroidaceae bacterium]|nr:UDP-N-acetylmuramate dehydrogenase [Bacteroidaceae bacterium]
MKHYTDYSLKSLHTFGMDVRAAHFVEYTSVDELEALLVRMQSEWETLPWLHMGGGSNLLFTSDYYQGVILHSAIKGWQVVDEDEVCVHLRVGAGVVWDELVAYTVAQGWGGMENLSLIPGEVGASAVQNIGAYGMEAKDLIETVDTIEIATGTSRTFACEECGYAYRQSVFKSELKGKFVVTHVTYRLQKNPVFHLDYGNIRAELERIGEGISLDTIRRAVIRIRESKLPDPQVTGNAGSFFMNPIVPRAVMEHIREAYPQMPFYEVDTERVKIPAGWMIEQCGWKGRALGRAAVHDKQALVLVNLGGATGREIIALSDAVRHDVKEKFGVDIHPEVNFIG